MADKKNENGNGNNNSIIKCWGKQRLKKSRSGGYIGLCETDCEFKDTCISKSRETQEFVIDQLTKRDFPDIDIATSCGDNCSADNNGNSGNSSASASVSSVIPAISPGSSWSMLIDDLNLSPEAATMVNEFLNRFAHLYFEAPKVIDAAMRKIVHNENQSDIARMKGVTRAAISKGILAQYAGILKPEIYVPAELKKPLEKVVYVLCFIGDLTYSEAAEKLNISERHVRRLSALIASKIGENVQNKNARLKKIKKNSVRIRRTKKQIEKDKRKEIEKAMQFMKEHQKGLMKEARKIRKRRTE